MIGNAIIGSIGNLIGSNSDAFSAEAEQIAKAEAVANEYIDTLTNIDEANKNIAKSAISKASSEQVANAAMNAGTAAINKQTIGQKALNVARAAGNVLLNAGIGIIVGMIATGFVTWLWDVAHAEERVAEAAENAKNNIKELNNNFNSQKTIVDEAIKSYDELAKGVDTTTNQNLSLSTEDYDKFLDLNNQLVEIFPELYDGLDENGNAILNLGENGKTAAEGLKEALNELQNLNNYKISQELPDLFAGVQQQLDKAKESAQEFETEYAEMQKSIGQMQALSIQGIEFTDNQFSVSGSINDSGLVEYMSLIEQSYNEFLNSLSDERLVELNPAFNISSNFDDITGEKSLTINIPWDQLLEDEQSEWESIIKENAQEMALVYTDEINTAFADNAQLQKEAELAWKDFLPSLISTMESKATFQELEELGDNTQDIVRDIVGNLTVDAYDDMGSDPYAWIRSNIIAPLTELSDSDRQKVIQLYEKLLNFNADEVKVNAQEVQAYVDNLINQIATLLGQDPIELKINLGLENVVDQDVVSESQRLTRQLIEQSTGTSSSSTIPEERQLYQNELSKANKKINELSINTTEETIAWNEALVEALENHEDLEYAIDVYNKKLENTVSESDTLSFGETITELDEMTSKFDQLDESYAKFADGDKDTNINFEDYAAIQEVFKDVKGIDEYIQRLQEVNGNAAETQQVFDELATALIEQFDLSENLTEENAGLITEYLELKGVVNANEIVYGQLQAQQMANTLGIQNLTNATIESLDATYSQINGLLGEADASGIATIALYQLISQQTIFSNSSLNTSQKIQELEKLAKAFGITADSAQVATAQANMASEISIAARNGDTESIAAIQEAYLAEIGSYYEDAIAARFGKLTASYTGGAATQGAIDKASSKSKKETEEIFDWMEEKIENLNEEIDKLTTKMEDAVGFRPKNTIADSIIAKFQEEADVYTQMIDRYNQELNSIGLSDDYVAKIKEGLIDIETITDETLLNQIKDYQEWDDKLEDCETQLIEVRQRIEEMQYTKLDNVIDQYDILSSSIENCISTQEQLIDLMGQTGEEVTFENYESLISKQEKLAQQYANAYRDLSNEMSQLNLEQGSEEWEKYNSQLEEYKQNVISCTSAVEDYKDEIFELTFKVLDEFNSRIEEVNNTISVMHDLIGSEGLIDENGLSDRGIAQVALYAHELSNAQKQVVEYEEAMDALEEAYDSGLITQEEYNEALSEYRSGQEAAVQATKQAQDAILQIVKDGIQAQIDAKQEEIDATKEQLAAEKELNDYREGIVDKSKQIAVLEKQIATLSLSTDRADIAQRLELEEQLADLREELISDQEDHAYDEQVDALDKYLESYTEEKEAEIDELETNLDAQTAAINEYLEKVKNNYFTVYGILNQYGDAYSVSAIEDLTDPWSKGSEAADLCSEAIGNVCSEISYDIAQIDMSPLYELVDLLTQINSLGGYGDGSGGYYEDISGQGEWQRGQGGRWWYGEPYSEDGDYWYADSGIYTIDGKQYSFDDNGYMQTEWVEDDNGNWRYFDANTGEMQKGIWIPGRNGEQYYLDKNGTMATNAAVKGENGQDYYYVDEDGVWDGKTLTYDEVKKLGLKVAYKKGTNNAKKGLALTDEEGLGSEVIITKYGALRQLNSGDHVFNADQVKTLYEMSSLTGLPNMLKDMEKNFANMGKNISYNTTGLTITSPLIQIDGTGMSSSDVANLINSQINDLPTRIMKAIKYNLR